VTNEPNRTTDEQLAAEAQDGMLDAFGELVERYHSHVYNFLYHKTASPQDAQDVTQQVFITAWQRIHQFRVEAKFATWLFTITRRLAINYYRARGSRRFVEIDETDPNLITTDTPATELAQRDDHAKLWTTARDCLNDNQFTALWLKYREHMSIREISTAMGKKQVTVKVLLHRARKALGVVLDGRGESARHSGIASNLLLAPLENAITSQPPNCEPV